MLGYGEAAVKLQRDWKVDAESLPFAHNIKGQALVSLVQKGLRYHHLSLTIDEVCRSSLLLPSLSLNGSQNGRPSRALNPSMFFFGPESEKPAQEIRDLAQRPSSSHRAASPPPVIPQKREPGPNGPNEGTPQPTAKRNRKTTSANADRNGATGRKQAPTSAGLVTNIELNAPNGHLAPIHDARSPSATEPGPDELGTVINGVQTEDRMDVDTDAEHGPDGRAETPMVHTLTNGESKAIQVEPAKIADLNFNTSILTSNDNTNLVQAAWHPNNSGLVAAYGDSLCGAWRTVGPRPLMQELIRFGGQEESVTAIAWEPGRGTLAVALATNAGCVVNLYQGRELSLSESLSASQGLCTRLQWQKSGSKLIGLAPEEDVRQGSTILLWDASESAQFPGPQEIPVPEALEDIDCAMFEGQGVVCAAGGSAVYHCRAYTELEVEQKWTSVSQDTPEKWSLVRCSWQSHSSLVVAASSETGRLWLPAKELIHDAHHGPITGLQIRPAPSSGVGALSASEFATCSVDGTIKAWTYDERSNSLLTLCKLTLGPSQPLKALSYSVDGFCLAGASYNDVRIWNAEHGYGQMATWQGQEQQWHGNMLKEEDLVSNGGMSSINGESSLAAEHSLSWAADSMSLSFSLGSQVRDLQKLYLLC